MSFSDQTFAILRLVEILGLIEANRSDQLGRITCPTLVIVPGAEPIGSTANYEPFRRRVRDVEMRVYEGAPHNICDAFPDRCAGDVLDFLGRRFGLGL